MIMRPPFLGIRRKVHGFQSPAKIQRLQHRYNDYNKDTTITTKIQRLQQRYNDYNTDTTITTKIVVSLL
jgi:hypothetical protein